ncbi:MAG: quinone oxidoreductase [Rhodospirillales bacterium]|nr:MAG: quinone oxidoreductase [Rhodospirillales bacterium]
MSTSSRVVRLAEQGPASVMRVETVEIASPGDGQALIRQTAAGVNYMDIYQRSGSYPLQLPSGIGLEAAGVVEAVGPDVDTVAPGDRVAYGGGPIGAYAERRLIPAGRLVRIPDGITDEQAAAVLMKGMTAEYLLNRTYPVKPGQWVLFYAAAGGVGLIAGQWGKALGARMIGIAGGPEKCELARANGYEHCIDRHAENVVEQVKALTGGAGVPVVYDSIGAGTFEQTLDCLAPRGYFVSFGTTGGPVPPVMAADLQHRGSLYFTRPTLATYVAAREDLEASAKAVFEMVAKGAVRVEIGQRYALDEAVKAHEDLEAGHTSGSSIITL